MAVFPHPPRASAHYPYMPPIWLLIQQGQEMPHIVFGIVEVSNWWKHTVHP